jgi:hypothetical protein
VAHFKKIDVMVEYFNNLREEEKVELLDALPLITVMIAGADGSFDQEELDWADKITHIRSYKLKKEMKAFYEEVDANFIEKVQYFIEAMPADVSQRNEIISDRLGKLNPILAKLDTSVAYKMYRGFLSFAEHIAKASGGIMGFFSVNAAEAKLIHLPMLHPIIYTPSQEEEE